ncbi:MAG: DUF1501 domain-containing protein [Myxococcales bacterium]|nr:DUF1501 domain-containing protein [Myxococcales bacterium]
MDRREFLKLCSVAGLGVVGSQAALSGSAQAAPFEGVVNLFLHLGGGWDSTLFADPKGDTVNAEGWFINDPMTAFSTDQIQMAGNISYPAIDANPAFFTEWYQWMTVIRGINYSTNGHDAGTRHMWSGALADGRPSFGALFASAVGREMPMAYISNGGYDVTNGVPVSKTRFSTDGIFQLIYPNRRDPNSENSELYYPDAVLKRINVMRQARLDRMREVQNLPSLKRSMGLLYTSRLGMEELKKIDEYLQLIEAQDPSGNGLGNGLARQGKTALAAAKAGLSCCANLTFGGWDTHGNNDQSVRNNLQGLVTNINEFLVTARDLLQMTNVRLIIGSDFGRTPEYNMNAGRDHWAVGSNVIIDLSGQMPGNRVIGSTDEYLRYQKVNPTTFEPDPSGVAIEPGHIHQWLRRVSGIEDAEDTKRYPVNVADELVLA